MNAIKTITTKLDEIFKPLDEKVLAASKQWAKERQQAIFDFQKTDEYEELRGVKNTWKRYERLFAIAGGKGWYQVFTSYSGDNLENYMTKNCEAITKKRNSNIATKLVKSGVTEVINEEFSHTNNGFNGLFVVNTDNGQKKVTISTIYAGGYNIQCLHLRVLTKIK